MTRCNDWPVLKRDFWTKIPTADSKKLRIISAIMMYTVLTTSLKSTIHAPFINSRSRWLVTYYLQSLRLRARIFQRLLLNALVLKSWSWISISNSYLTLPIFLTWLQTDHPTENAWTSLTLLTAVINWWHNCIQNITSFISSELHLHIATGNTMYSIHLIFSLEFNHAKPPFTNSANNSDDGGFSRLYKRNDAIRHKGLPRSLYEHRIENQVYDLS